MTVKLWPKPLGTGTEVVLKTNQLTWRWAWWHLFRKCSSSWCFCRRVTSRECQWCRPLSQWSAKRMVSVTGSISPSVLWLAYSTHSPTCPPTHLLQFSDYKAIFFSLIFDPSTLQLVVPYPWIKFNNAYFILKNLSPYTQHVSRKRISLHIGLKRMPCKTDPWYFPGK